MSEDPFDLLMSSADPPLIVVTTVAGGARAGCLVGFHGQASIEPKRLFPDEGVAHVARRAGASVAG